MNEFVEFELNEALIKALDTIKITSPTPIQVQAIPLLLEGDDVIGQAQTGTGKTFAYAIPLIERIDLTKKEVQALVMCPTRELALQVSNEITKLATYTKLKVATIYGGASYEKQFKDLKKNPQVVIGTPGRIIDHLERGTLSFKSVSYLVLDEADEMLKMGFQEDMEKILSSIETKHQTALFSATLPPFIKSLAKKYLVNPLMVKIETKTLTVDKISQFVYYSKKEDRKNLLIRLLDYYQFNSIMIFANTKAMVDELALFLQENHFKADGLHGDLKQTNRDKVMQSFRLQATEILIATDVAARGLDIDDVDAVINFDLPLENEIYVHRIGRTGRAGKEGIAISLATSRQNRRISELEAFAKTKINRLEIPSVKEIKLRSQKNLFAKIEEAIDDNIDNHNYDNLLYKLAKKTTDPSVIIISLIEMLNKNTTNREYPPIDTVLIRNKGSLNKEPKKPKFYYIALNIGQKEHLRPNQLVNYLHDELKIHREHFGKVVIEKEVTYFEITDQGLKFLKPLNGKKFNGKKLTYRQVQTMPKKK